MGGIQVSVSGSAASATDNLSKLSTEWEKQSVVPAGTSRFLKKVGIFGAGTNLAAMRVYKGNKIVATLTGASKATYDPLALMTVNERFNSGDVITVELTSGSGGPMASHQVVMEWADYPATTRTYNNFQSRRRWY